MQIGFHLTPFWSPTDRSPTAILDEAIEVVSAASKMGYAWVSIGHHWMSSPTVWPAPYPMLARLAPTIATTALARASGVNIFRVHDVPENVRALKITDAILNAPIGYAAH